MTRHVEPNDDTTVMNLHLLIEEALEESGKNADVETVTKVRRYGETGEVLLTFAGRRFQVQLWEVL